MNSHFLSANGHGSTLLVVSDGNDKKIFKMFKSGIIKLLSIKMLLLRA